MGHYLSKSAGLAAGGNTSTSQLQTSDSLYHIGRDDQQRPFRPFESFQIPLRVISPNRRPSLTPSFEVFMLEWFNSRQNRTPGPGDDRNHHVQLSYCCFKAYTQMFGRWMGVRASLLALSIALTACVYQSQSMRQHCRCIARTHGSSTRHYLFLRCHCNFPLRLRLSSTNR